MKNTLTINPGEGCLCECLDRVNDGSNSIYLMVRVGAVMMPKLTLDGEVIYLESNKDNLVEIPESKFIAGAVIGFTYSDSEHTCDTFTITFPDKLEGELSLKRVDNFRYNAQYTTIGGSSYTLPVASATTLGGVKVGDTLTIGGSGTLNAKVDNSLNELSSNPVQNKVVTAKMNEVFQSVSDGKKEVALAITDKGVPTEADATFSTMAHNIGQISTGGGSGGGEITSAIYNTHIIVDKMTCNSNVEIKDG